MIFPSRQPMDKPSSQPYCHPTLHPSLQPFQRPSSQPLIHPSSQPSFQPFCSPSFQPFSEPSKQPTNIPSLQPFIQPSIQPSLQPLRIPSVMPTIQPTQKPVNKPKSSPTKQPLRKPSSQPTFQPTLQPSENPSLQPSRQPTNFPILYPSSQPLKIPTIQPSLDPSNQPNQKPSSQPSLDPSRQPTTNPSSQPYSSPSSKPSQCPSIQPTRQPLSHPSVQPSDIPSLNPTIKPSNQPSSQPTVNPSLKPTIYPSLRSSTQPSQLPTKQPILKPTTQPSQNPSYQPLANPSWQPSSQPSSQPRVGPSSQPSLIPSLHPTAQPSCYPSTQPTEMPSLNPSAFPSTQPSSQPTAFPSKQPILSPSLQPSTQPSSNPSFQPFSIPTFQPSKQPSMHPSNNPSHQPSRQPSYQPFILPSSQPTSSPLVNGTGCPENTFYLSKGNICLNCTIHSYTLKKGSLTCLCSDGYSEFGFGTTLKCTKCESGKYGKGSPKNCSTCPSGKYSPNSGSGKCLSSPAGYYSLSGMTNPLSCKSGTYSSLPDQSNCSYCLPGKYSQGEGNSICISCPIGYYNSLYQQSSCSTCQTGAITPFVGAISDDQCVVLLPNFLIGLFTLVAVAIIYVFYILLGNFHKVSFKRKQKLVLPVAKACIQIGEKVSSNYMSPQLNLESSKKLYTLIKIIFFLLTATVSYIAVILITSFFILGRIFFNAFIIWRGINLYIDTSFLDIIAKYLGIISKVFRIPFPILNYISYPIVLLFTVLSSINLDLLSAIKVTCEGSKAPAELFTDCIILGLVIMFITANYQVLWTITYPTLNMSYLNHLTATSKNILKEKTFYFAIAMILINSFNPFQAILRFMLTFVVLTPFFSKDGISHQVTVSCDQIEGVYHFDSILGYTSSVIFWLLIMPTIYIFSDVVVPRLLHENLEKSISFSSVLSRKFSSFSRNVYQLKNKSIIRNKFGKRKAVDDPSSNKTILSYDPLTVFEFIKKIEIKNDLVTYNYQLIQKSQNIDVKLDTSSYNYIEKNERNDEMLSKKQLEFKEAKFYAQIVVQNCIDAAMVNISKARSHESLENLTLNANNNFKNDNSESSYLFDSIDLSEFSTTSDISEFEANSFDGKIIFNSLEKKSKIVSNVSSPNSLLYYDTSDNGSYFSEEASNKKPNNDKFYRNEKYNYNLLNNKQESINNGNCDYYYDGRKDQQWDDINHLYFVPDYVGENKMFSVFSKEFRDISIRTNSTNISNEENDDNSNSSFDISNTTTDDYEDDDHVTVSTLTGSVSSRESSFISVSEEDISSYYSSILDSLFLSQDDSSDFRSLDSNSYLSISNEDLNLKKMKKNKNYFCKKEWKLLKSSFRYISSNIVYTFSIDMWLTKLNEKWIRLLSEMFNTNEDFVVTYSTFFSSKISYGHSRIFDRRSNNISLAESVDKFSKLSSLEFFSNNINKNTNNVISNLLSFEDKASEENAKLDAMWKQMEYFNLPNYFRLCQLVQRDLYVRILHSSSTMKNNFILKLPIFIISYFLAFTGIGHFFSATGFNCWKKALSKYGQFLMVCFGIWTEDSAIAYDLDGIKETMCFKDDDMAMGNIIRAVVGVRALIFQLFPLLTVLSVVIITVSGSPLFLIGEKMSNRLPPLIITNPFKVAKEREERLRNKDFTIAGSSQYWIVYLRTIQVFFTESRLLLFIYNLSLVVLSILIIYQPDSSFIVYVVFMGIIVFFIFLYSFSVVIFLGEVLGIKDSDFLYNCRIKRRKLCKVMPLQLEHLDKDHFSGEQYSDQNNISSLVIMSSDVSDSLSPIVVFKWLNKYENKDFTDKEEDKASAPSTVRNMRKILLKQTQSSSSISIDTIIISDNSKYDEDDEDDEDSYLNFSSGYNTPKEDDKLSSSIQSSEIENISDLLSLANSDEVDKTESSQSITTERLNIEISSRVSLEELYYSDESTYNSNSDQEKSIKIIQNDYLDSSYEHNTYPYSYDNYYTDRYVNYNSDYNYFQENQYNEFVQQDGFYNSYDNFNDDNDIERNYYDNTEYYNHYNNNNNYYYNYSYQSNYYPNDNESDEVQRWTEKTNNNNYSLVSSNNQIWDELYYHQNTENTDNIERHYNNSVEYNFYDDQQMSNHSTHYYSDLDFEYEDSSFILDSKRNENTYTNKFIYQQIEHLNSHKSCDSDISSVQISDDNVSENNYTDNSIENNSDSDICSVVVSDDSSIIINSTENEISKRDVNNKIIQFTYQQLPYLNEVNSDSDVGSVIVSDDSSYLIDDFITEIENNNTTNKDTKTDESKKNNEYNGIGSNIIRDDNSLNQDVNKTPNNRKELNSFILTSKRRNGLIESLDNDKIQNMVLSDNSSLSSDSNSDDSAEINI